MLHDFPPSQGVNIVELPWGVCCAEPSMSRNALLSLFHLWVQQLQDFHHCILMAFLMKVHTRQIHWRNVEFTGTLCDQHTDLFTVRSFAYYLLLNQKMPSGIRAYCWLPTSHPLWDVNLSSGDLRSRKGRLVHVLHDAVAMSNYKLYGYSLI